MAKATFSSLLALCLVVGCGISELPPAAPATIVDQRPGPPPAAQLVAEATEPLVEQDIKPTVIEEFNATVFRVTAGDSLTIQIDKALVSVHLEGVASPKDGQPFHKQSLEELRTQLLGKTVTVQKTGVSNSNGIVGNVLVEGVNVNVRMIEAGLAWHDRRLNHDLELKTLEVEARKARIGLWADSSPIPPWEWQTQHEAAAQPLKSVVANQPSKRTPMPDTEPLFIPPTSSKKPRKGVYQESEAEKAYEAANGVEVVHRKDGTTYERKALKKK